MARVGHHHPYRGDIQRREGAPHERRLHRQGRWISFHGKKRMSARGLAPRWISRAAWRVRLVQRSEAVAIKEGFKCAVLGVHHPSKRGELRGSTVLLGAGDFVFRLERKKGLSVAKLICEKQKDAPDGWSDHYRLDEVTMADGAVSLVPARALTPAANGQVNPQIVGAERSHPSPETIDSKGHFRSSYNFKKEQLASFYQRKTTAVRPHLQHTESSCASYARFMGEIDKLSK